jgi:hypothetical protein
VVAIADLDADLPGWERQPREPSRAYAAFRRFRDLGPSRAPHLVVEASDGDLRPHTVARWQRDWHWTRRAREWDDHLYRVEDEARLDALRTMHRSHALTGRYVVAKALGALQRVDDADISPSSAARLIEVGARLERSTLVQSVADLQGIDREAVAEDPWDVIARELQGTAAPVRDTAPS